MLRGPVPAGIEHYRAWTLRHELPLHVAVLRPDVNLLDEWIAALGKHAELRARAVATIATAAQTSAQSVELLADSHGRDARVLFERAAAAGNTQAFACAVLGRGPAPSQASLHSLAELLSGTEARTALLVVIEEHSEVAARELERLTQVLELSPSLDVGVVIPRAALQQLRAGPDARWKALLREGFVDVATSPPMTPTVQLNERAARERTRLIVGGAPSSVVEAFDCAAGVDTVSTPEGVARSRYEALLFGVLDHHAETAGQFELNGKLGFKFGKRAVEVDLLNRRLGIAVEVDGFFHFSGPQASRRDRRKDLLLQQHEYIVVRVDTDQLVADLSAVVGTILETVRLRRSALQEKQW